MTAVSSGAVPATSLRHDDEGWSKRICHIGHPITKSAFNSGQVDIVAIDDPFNDLRYMVYMLQYDFATENSMGQSREQDPANIKWSDAGAEYVVESIGVFTTLEKAGLI
ncbi:PREDICTED: glyceraldehyde-3-phosphate [Lynx pardinus]|uniref:Glyceraldehyde-3-phosphate dehydrogenase n=1 Tax=Lynx pardinus TaxID=191816 RepID=A0A485PSL9_LYNPA|nr:PREDICTED: glyceraldehyde-3-phosphate [Lynx pardinus]